MWEAVYNGSTADSILLTESIDAINMGTFNFVGDFESNPLGHFEYDVLPWILYGTSKSGSSTAHTRAMDALTSGFYTNASPSERALMLDLINSNMSMRGDGFY